MVRQPPAELALFQESYSQYLRAPSKHSLPPGIPVRRSEVYESLLFNNISGFINKCFPVAKTLFGAEQWPHLIRAFYEQWQCRTPIFSQIPKEFVGFIDSAPPLNHIPAWLPELLHYEWLELEVELDDPDHGQPLDSGDDRIFTNPTLRMHGYEWPVHKLSPSFLPSEPEPVILCVYRTKQWEVRFMEINSVTAMLLQLLEQQPQTAQSALAHLTDQLPQLAPAQVHHFGSELIAQLLLADVLTGPLQQV